MALYFEYRINKNALLEQTAILPTGYYYYYQPNILNTGQY